MQLAADAIGALCIIAAFLLTLVNEFPRGRVFLAIAGATLVTGGLVQRIENRGARLVEAVSGGVTEAISGVAVEFLGLLAFAVVVARAIYKKKASRWTTVAAFLLPALALTAGEAGGGSVVFAICQIIGQITVEIINGIGSLVGSIGG